MIEAVKNNDLDEVKRLHENGADLTTPHFGNWNGLKMNLNLKSFFQMSLEEQITIQNVSARTIS